MQIKKDASVAVVLKRDWANLQGVRLFLLFDHRPVCSFAFVSAGPITKSFSVASKLF